MEFNRIYQSGMIVIYDLHQRSVRDLQRCRTPRNLPTAHYMPKEYTMIVIIEHPSLFTTYQFQANLSKFKHVLIVGLIIIIVLLKRR